MNVVLIGASSRSDRYAYRAFQLLRRKGHTVFPVHPHLRDLEGQPVFASVTEIPGPVHTVTLYVSRVHSQAMIDDILMLKPERIVFNPGAENETLQMRAEALGIEAVSACTLALLTAGTF